MTSFLSSTPAASPWSPPRATNDPLKCEDNRYCVQLRRYRGLIDFTRDMGHQVGFFESELPTTER